MLYEFKNVKESTCRRWFAKFLNGEEGLKDQNRSGRKNLSSIIDNNGEYLV
jgi:transposase